MSKKYLLFLSGIIAAVTLSGCDQKEQPKEPVSTESSVSGENAATEDMTETPATAEALASITPSDYLVKNSSEYVTLGNLENLEVTQYVFEVTDDMIQERIESDLTEVGEEVEVDRAAAEGDVVYADVTSTVHGEPDTTATESTYITLGYAEYSEDFDKQITGAKANDLLTFTCSFDNDAIMDEWANKAVDFEVKITSVCEMQTPEYNDAYVKEFTDYSTTKEYEEAIRELLTEEYEENGYSDTVEALFQAAIDASTFSGYPDELYDACKEEVLSLYGGFLGTTDEQEIYEAFDLSPDDVETEVLSMVNRRLIVSSVCADQNLEITQEEYNSFVMENAEAFGYESAVQFEEENTRSSLVWSLYENAVAALLYDSAKITPVPYEEEEIDADETFEETETETTDNTDEFDASNAD